jgi:DNA-binding protein H-NS
MRRPRDFGSELKALTDKANMLKERKIRQFGELVIATGADNLDPETLTGALLVIAETREAAKKEGWRTRGAASGPLLLLRNNQIESAVACSPSKSQRAASPETSVPANCATINIGASLGAIPEKLSVKLRAMVMAGLAKLVDEVNQ